MEWIDECPYCFTVITYEIKSVGHCPCGWSSNGSKPSEDESSKHKNPSRILAKQEQNKILDEARKGVEEAGKVPLRKRNRFPQSEDIKTVFDYLPPEHDVEGLKKYYKSLKKIQWTFD